MYYVVGLGNPGDKYKKTRHNVGWQVLDYFIEKSGLPTPVLSSARSGRLSEGVVFGQEISVLYPDTFMNNSGSAVKKLVPKSEIGNLIVIYDDIDLPIGEVKISVGRGDGGHNGIKSIINAFSSKDFIRVRIGIAPVSFWTGKVKRPLGAALPSFVLKSFSGREEKKLEEVKEKVFSGLKTILESGVEQAMNEIN